MKYFFISDLHLSSKRPDLTHGFFKFLKSLPADTDKLFILGDFFDAWIGDDSIALDPYAQSVLNQLQKVKVEIYFIVGNRDFLIGQQFADYTGTTLLPDPFILQIEKKKVLLSHGDLLCTKDYGYFKFRKMVRNHAWQKDFLSKPLSERLSIATNMRQKSQESTQEKSFELMDVNPETVQLWFHKYQCDLMIHGHTHRPAHHFAGMQMQERIVLGDWNSSAKYLMIDFTCSGTNYELANFHLSEQPPA